MNWPGLIEDGLPLLILLSGTIILTTFIVWLLFRRRYDGLRAKFDRKTGEFSELQNTYNLLLAKQEELNTKLSELNATHQSLNLRYEHQKGLLNECTQKRADLESENILLMPYKRKYEQLLELHTAQGREIDELKTALTDMKVRKEGLQDALIRERNENKMLHDEVIRLQSFENKYRKLKDELEKGTPPGRSEGKVRKKQTDSKAAKESKSAKEEEALKRIQERSKEINFERIGTATADEKEDLKKIKGIGPFIEKKLYSIGIYTLRQIANFQSVDEDKVNEVIEFFPGRVKRDQWSKQARSLLKGKEKKNEGKKRDF